MEAGASPGPMAWEKLLPRAENHSDAKAEAQSPGWGKDIVSGLEVLEAGVNQEGFLEEGTSDGLKSPDSDQRTDPSAHLDASPPACLTPGSLPTGQLKSGVHVKCARV